MKILSGSIIKPLLQYGVNDEIYGGLEIQHLPLLPLGSGNHSPTYPMQPPEHGGLLCRGYLGAKEISRIYEYGPHPLKSATEVL